MIYGIVRVENKITIIRQNLQDLQGIKNFRAVDFG